MKTPFLYRVMGIVTILFIAGLANAETYRFQVEKGEVTSTPSRCIPGQCESQSSALTGTFTASIDTDEIIIKTSKLASESGSFTLPEFPNSEANGSVFIAQFSFSDNTLSLVGSMDSRAFDGPLQEYTIVASVIMDESERFDPIGYYHVRQDFRKCVSPMCGGIYATKVNGRRMHCPDGSRARECYIGTLNWDAIGGSPFSATATPIVKGSVSVDLNRGSEWGVFTAEAAYRPASDKISHKKVFGLQNNGIVCISAPCFSYDEYVINRKHVRKVSGFDLSRVKANKADIEEALSILAEGETLIIEGQNRRSRHFDFRGDVNRGVNLVASQFYLPIGNKTLTDVCDEGYNITDFGCATKYGCFYPQLELMTIGGALMIDPETGEPRSNISYSCVDECEFPSDPLGAGRCQLNLP